MAGASRGGVVSLQGNDFIGDYEGVDALRVIGGEPLQIRFQS